MHMTPPDPDYACRDFYAGRAAMSHPPSPLSQDKAGLAGFQTAPEVDTIDTMIQRVEKALSSAEHHSIGIWNALTGLDRYSTADEKPAPVGMIDKLRIIAERIDVLGKELSESRAVISR